MKASTREAVSTFLAIPAIIGLMTLAIGILGPIADFFEKPSQQTFGAVDGDGRPVQLSFAEKYVLLSKTWKPCLGLIALGAVSLLWERATRDKATTAPKSSAPSPSPYR